MAGPVNNLQGKRIGRLVVLEYVPGTKKPPRVDAKWKCVCDCGNRSTVLASTLLKGLTKSCGCIHKEWTKKMGLANKRHGLSDTKPHQAWSSMRSRCSDPMNKNFKNYGGRGIKVCKRWEVFENFLSDMGMPKDGDSIERINNNKGYSKANCKWIPRREQNYNKRTNLLITILGETKCASLWAKQCGVSLSCMCRRFHKGIRGLDLLKPSKKLGE